MLSLVVAFSLSALVAQATSPPADPGVQWIAPVQPVVAQSTSHQLVYQRSLQPELRLFGGDGFAFRAVASIDVESGLPLWTRAATAYTAYLEPGRVALGADGTAYEVLLGYPSVLIATDRDGRRLWSVTISGVGSPSRIHVADNGTVYLMAPSSAGSGCSARLSRIAEDRSGIAWSVPVPPVACGGRVLGTPGGDLVLASQRGAMRIRAEDGSARWTYTSAPSRQLQVDYGARPTGHAVFCERSSPLLAGDPAAEIVRLSFDDGSELGRVATAMCPTWLDSFANGDLLGLIEQPGADALVRVVAASGETWWSIPVESIAALDIGADDRIAMAQTADFPSGRLMRIVDGATGAIQAERELPPGRAIGAIVLLSGAEVLLSRTVGVDTVTERLRLTDGLVRWSTGMPPALGGALYGQVVAAGSDGVLVHGTSISGGAYQGVLRVLERATGALRWERQVPLSGRGTPENPLSASGNAVAAANGDVLDLSLLSGYSASPGSLAVLQRFDPAGTTLWSRQYGVQSIGAIEDLEQFVLVGDAVMTTVVRRAHQNAPLTTHLQRIDAVSGQLQWELQEAHSSFGLRSVAGHVLAVGYEVPPLRAFDPSNGAVRWQRGAATVVAYPHVAARLLGNTDLVTVFTAGDETAVMHVAERIRADTGAVLWSRAWVPTAASGSFRPSAFVSDQDEVFVTGSHRHGDGAAAVHAVVARLDPATGDTLWLRELEDQGRRGWVQQMRRLGATELLLKRQIVLDPGTGLALSLLERLDAATGATLSTHRLDTGAAVDGSQPGAAAYDYAVGPIDDHLILAGTSTPDIGESTLTVARLAWPAVPLTGDARLVMAQGAASGQEERTQEVAFDLQYDGGAIANLLVVDLSMTPGFVGTARWTCEAVVPAQCAQASGPLNQAPVVAMQTGGSAAITVNVAHTVRNHGTSTLYAMIGAPSGFGDTHFDDNYRVVELRGALLGDSFE